MFNVNDLVVHANLGTCRIIDVSIIENQVVYIIQKQDKISPTKHEVSGRLIRLLTPIM